MTRGMEALLGLGPVSLGSGLNVLRQAELEDLRGIALTSVAQEKIVSNFPEMIHPCWLFLCNARLDCKTYWDPKEASLLRNQIEGD